jgi:hypothetical protein
LIAVFLFNVATDELASGLDVHDSAELEDIPTQQEDQAVAESTSEDKGQEATTSTPIALGTRKPRFSSPRNLQIAKAAEQKGSSFRFTGSARERNRAKARRLFSQAKENNVLVEAPSKRGS